MAILKPYNAVLSEEDVSVILETSTQVLVAHPLAAQDIIRAIRWLPFLKPLLDQMGVLDDRVDTLTDELRKLATQGKELEQRGKELERRAEEADKLAEEWTKRIEELEEWIGQADERT